MRYWSYGLLHGRVLPGTFISSGGIVMNVGELAISPVRLWTIEIALRCSCIEGELLKLQGKEGARHIVG